MTSQRADGVLEGGGVGGGRTRTDGGEIIARDVREDESQNVCRRRFRQSSAFHRGQMLSDRIDLDDGCAGSKQQLGCPSFVVESQTMLGQGEQTRSAP